MAIFSSLEAKHPMGTIEKLYASLDLLFWIYSLRVVLYLARMDVAFRTSKKILCPGWNARMYTVMTGFLALTGFQILPTIM
jgi:hypothetical protein